MDSLSISPSTAVEANVTLEMVYSTSDIDVEALTVEFTWTDDTGTLLGTNSTLTLDSSRPVGSTITATITVTDGYGGIDIASETITILNTDPTVSSPASISSSPAPVTTGVLTCNASFSDYNDGSLSPTYSWTLLDGTPLASVGNTLTIDPNTTDPTDEIVCTASTSDNDGASITSSTSVLVQNTAPSVDSLSITPDTSVEANVTLEMVYSASDIDYENLTTTFAWTDSAGTVLGTGSTLTLDNSRPVGSTITATVTTLDGYGASDSASETIVIVNTEPSLDQAAEIVSTPSAKLPDC